MTHENSTKAYEEHKASGKRDCFRWRIWFAYSQFQNDGLTDREIMEIINEPDPNNVRPEITRLKKDGLLAEIGKTKCHKTGKTVRLCKTTNLPYFHKGGKGHAK